MDGVLVAYHNTARIFGFQYIPLEEMEERLYGGKGRGDRVFEKCVGVLEVVADEITRSFPEQSLKCMFETTENSKEMNVWVQPAEWSGTGTRPIVQLDVTSTSYLNQLPVNGPDAVTAKMTDCWKLHWTVSRSSRSEDEIHKKLEAAKDRLVHELNLPSGIEFADMPQYWNMIDFSGNESAAESAPPYNPSNFRKPAFGIQKLRALARAGRKATDQIALETVGTKKVVWYEPDGPEAINDTTPTLAQSSGGFRDSLSVDGVFYPEVENPACVEGSTSPAASGDQPTTQHGEKGAITKATKDAPLRDMPESIANTGRGPEATSPARDDSSSAMEGTLRNDVCTQQSTESSSSSRNERPWSSSF